MIGSTSWNQSMVRSIFPSPIDKYIINTPILDRFLIWSMKDWFGHPPRHGSSRSNLRMEWLLKTGLTRRMAIHIVFGKLFGKVSSLPLVVFTSTYLSQTPLATYVNNLKKHFITCSLHTRLKSLWWNSKWQIKLDAFQHLEIHQWIKLFSSQEPYLSCG